MYFFLFCIITLASTVSKRIEIYTRTKYYVNGIFKSYCDVDPKNFHGECWQGIYEGTCHHQHTLIPPVLLLILLQLYCLKIKSNLDVD